MSGNNIKFDNIFKAAKAFKNEIPALKAHTVRIKFPGGGNGSFYRVMYEKVNERGNLVGFEIHVPNYVV